MLNANMLYVKMSSLFILEIYDYCYLLSVTDNSISCHASQGAKASSFAITVIGIFVMLL
jgi:hypothetical protein